MQKRDSPKGDEIFDILHRGHARASMLSCSLGRNSIGIFGRSQNMSQIVNVYWVPVYDSLVVVRMLQSI